MNFDIRLPIGLLFGVLGLILTGFGLFTGAEATIYARSLGHNINLQWGLVMVLFAAIMLVLAWRGRKNRPAPR